MKHLRYCMMSAYQAGIKEHPQEVMKALGIGYEKSIPQSIGDQWWFLNVTTDGHLPPPFLTDMKVGKELARTFGLPDSYINENYTGVK